jgi:hypothetical protein
MYGKAIYVYSWHNLIVLAKEELWKLKYFSMQKYNLQNNPSLKKAKILQDTITNVKFEHKPKYHLSKILK